MISSGCNNVFIIIDWRGFSPIGIPSVQFFIRISTKLLLEPFIHRKCMTNCILKYINGFEFVSVYSPTSSTAIPLGIIKSIIWKMIGILLFKIVVYILQCHFLSRMLTDNVAQHIGITGVRCRRFSTFLRRFLLRMSGSSFFWCTELMNWGSRLSWRRLSSMSSTLLRRWRLRWWFKSRRSRWFNGVGRWNRS